MSECSCCFVKKESFPFCCVTMAAILQFKNSVSWGRGGGSEGRRSLWGGGVTYYQREKFSYGLCTLE